MVHCVNGYTFKGNNSDIFVYASFILYYLRGWGGGGEWRGESTLTGKCLLLASFKSRVLLGKVLSSEEANRKSEKLLTL